MQRKAIIFDVDGVLLDTEMTQHQQLTATLWDAGVQVSEEDMLKLVGSTMVNKIAWVREHVDPRIDSEAILAETRRRIGIHSKEFPELLMPGVEETLSWLKKQGFILGIASNSTQTRLDNMLRDTLFGKYIDVTASATAEGRLKPDPAVYLKMLKLLGLPAEECLAVEDSTMGITAAVAAGIDVAAQIDERFCFDQSKARYHIHRLSDLREILQNEEATEREGKRE